MWAFINGIPHHQEKPQQPWPHILFAADQLQSAITVLKLEKCVMCRRIKYVNKQIIR
jgi:hypothetical protein